MNKKKILEQIIKVNHAGEFAAIQIYNGQLKKFSKKPDLFKLIEEMKKTEENHLSFFFKEMNKNKVAPTILLPLWKALSYSLGYVSAACGKSTAMACTVAIEETIDKHYQKQISLLKKYQIKDEEFIKNIEKIREEEIEHKNTGIEEEAKKAPFYKAINKIVSTGCKVAIMLSKRI